MGVSLSQAAVHGCSLCSLYESAWLRVQRAKIQLHSACQIVNPGTASTQRGCLFSILHKAQFSLVAGLALELAAINSTVVVCSHVCLPPKILFFFFLPHDLVPQSGIECEHWRCKHQVPTTGPPMVFFFLWLCWVFVVALGLSQVEMSGSYFLVGVQASH